jgi:hypothetical protein
MEIIAVELVLVLGSVIGFAWWQLRDLDREKKKRDAQRAPEAPQPPSPAEQERPS